MSESSVGSEIKVEVVLAMPKRQLLIELDVKNGTTLAEAIELSGILEKFEGFELDLDKVGIFAHMAQPDQVLKNGDRVEIYRPLVADPKEARRQRALKQKKN